MHLYHSAQDQLSPDVLLPHHYAVDPGFFLFDEKKITNCIIITYKR